MAIQGGSSITLDVPKGIAAMGVRDICKEPNWWDWGRIQSKSQY